jgi:hypothetical protein
VSEYRQLAFAFILIAWVAIIAASLTGCEHGANIPIDIDPCLIEGVEDCAPECTSETDITLRTTRAYNDGYADGAREYRVLLERCLATEDKPAPRCHKPHRNTRGKGHIRHTFDLDSDDPLEGLQ